MWGNAKDHDRSSRIDLINAITRDDPRHICMCTYVVNDAVYWQRAITRFLSVYFYSTSQPYVIITIYHLHCELFRFYEYLGFERSSKKLERWVIGNQKGVRLLVSTCSTSINYNGRHSVTLDLLIETRDSLYSVVVSIACCSYLG